MAYYGALIAAWNSGATLPSGVTGTAFAAGDTDIQKIDKVNDWTITGPNQPVPVLTIATWLREQGLWLPIKAAAAAGSSQGAVAAIDYNEDPRTDTLDFSLAAVQAMLADLVSHNLLTQAQSNALVAMGTPQVPWVTAESGADLVGPVTNADVSLSGLDGSAWEIVIGTPTIDQTNGNITTTISFQDGGATQFTRQTFGNLTTASIQAQAMAILQNFINNTANITTIPTTPISVTS